MKIQYLFLNQFSLTSFEFENSLFNLRKTQSSDMCTMYISMIYFFIYIYVIWVNFLELKNHLRDKI